MAKNPLNRVSPAARYVRYALHVRLSGEQAVSLRTTLRVDRLDRRAFAHEDRQAFAFLPATNQTT